MELPKTFCGHQKFTDIWLKFSQNPIPNNLNLFFLNFLFEIFTEVYFGTKRDDDDDDDDDTEYIKRWQKSRTFF